MKRQWIIIAASALFMGSGNQTVTAQTAVAENPDDALYNRAMAAGYKAQFICSGLWNGGKTLEQIERDELTGIYTHIADIVPTLDAEIDESERQVKVTFADDTPPRTAIWNYRTGCTAMPIGFGGIKTGTSVKLRDLQDDLAWPNGDITPSIRADKTTAAIRNAVAAGFPDEASKKGKTSGILVIRNGRIIAEQYALGHGKHTGQRTWSVAKSIAGTLAGNARYRSLNFTELPAEIPAWRQFGDPRASIKMDNLLRMASGLYSDTAGNRTDPVYMGGASISERATSWPLTRQPGTYFRYANNDTLLAVQALQTADSDFNPYDFFQKIGMTRTYAETDWQDNYILSSQVWTTARDLGRLGQLYLNNGVWTDADGKQERLLPEDWREYVSTPSGPQPDRTFGYGATFWLMNKSEGIPADTFAGFGNRGQYLVIIPSMDLIIVRRGYDSAANRFNIEEFTRNIVAAAN